MSEIIPIRTSDRISFELRPVADGHEWVAVSRVGERLTAIVSPIAYLDVRACRATDDAMAGSDEAIKKARVEVWHKGAHVGGVEAIPEVHIYSLAGRILALSAVGADPFGVAPAESQP